jgi:hypothetical protein
MFYRAQNFTDEEWIIIKSVDPSIQATPVFSPIKGRIITLLLPAEIYAHQLADGTSEVLEAIIDAEALAQRFDQSARLHRLSPAAHPLSNTYLEMPA